MRDPHGAPGHESPSRILWSPSQSMSQVERRWDDAIQADRRGKDSQAKFVSFGRGSTIQEGKTEEGLNNMDSNIEEDVCADITNLTNEALVPTESGVKRAGTVGGG